MAIYNGRIDMRIDFVLDTNQRIERYVTIYNGRASITDLPFEAEIRSVEIEDIDILEKVQYEKEIATLNNELAKLNRAYQNLEYRHQQTRKELFDRDEQVLRRVSIEQVVKPLLSQLSLGDAINSLVDAYMKGEE